MTYSVTAWLALTYTIAVVSGCNADTDFVTESVVWGEVDGKSVHLLTVRNPNGVILRMTDYGAKLVELHVPDRSGDFVDIVLGFDNLQQYIEPNQSIGATIGRYANRIRDAQFEIDGATYQLSKNEGENNIHGGGEFEGVVWESEFIDSEEGTGIRFDYLSPDGSEGFPGDLASVVTYILTPGNAVQITFEAETDKSTHVNFTQHSYFNLNGASAMIHDHIARINADSYLVMDGVLVTGELDSLEGKPWNLSTPTRLGDNMDRIPLGGYHHDYVIDKPAGELAIVAEVSDPESGRMMIVSSTQPDVTFYVAMGLTDDLVGKYGIAYGPYMAFCVETQHSVDAANHAHFPSTLLRPGEKYQETVVYDFDIIPGVYE